MATASKILVSAAPCSVRATGQLGETTGVGGSGISPSGVAGVALLALGQRPPAASLSASASALRMLQLSQAEYALPMHRYSTATHLVG
jgi:hypothetical protein